MNTPTNTPASDGLPEPNYDSPMVTLTISNPVFPKEKESKPAQQREAACPHCKGRITMPAPAPDKAADKEDTPPVFWLLSKPHPFVPNIAIRRMHVMEGAVHVFSTSDDRQTCIIDEIPLENVRLIEKGMRYEVFVEELEDADDYDPEPDPEPEPTNGAQVSAPAVPSSSVS